MSTRKANNLAHHQNICPLYLEERLSSQNYPANLPKGKTKALCDRTTALEDDLATSCVYLTVPLGSSSPSRSPARYETKRNSGKCHFLSITAFPITFQQPRNLHALNTAQQLYPLIPALHEYWSHFPKLSYYRMKLMKSIMRMHNSSFITLSSLDKTQQI